MSQLHNNKKYLQDNYGIIWFPLTDHFPMSKEIPIMTN